MKKRGVGHKGGAMVTTHGTSFVMLQYEDDDDDDDHDGGNDGSNRDNGNGTRMIAKLDNSVVTVHNDDDDDDGSNDGSNSARIMKGNSVLVTPNDKEPRK